MPSPLRSISRRAAVGSAAITLFFLAGLTALPVSAATVALTGTHMAAKAGSNRPSVTHFRSKTRAVYFDYTVVTPSSNDTGEIKIFAGTPSGKLMASASLVFGVAASFDAKLAPAKGAWADGSYCSVLYVDGVAQTLGGAMPIGWSVGKVTQPGCKNPALHIKVSGKLRVGQSRSLAVTVRASHHPVHHALVELKGSGVGLTSVYQGYTNSKGTYTFRAIKPSQKGSVVITATKKNFRSAKKTIAVAA